ncbi:MAG: YbfB/YjiJ family MFS transporter [Phycisphaerales bacterium]|nr:YbfB/YjiJ family MFS transporter [Phycisphaerales bacterium]
MLAAIGLIRYAYSPLVPAMIIDHWLTGAEVGYIGTVNFLGSLIGAVTTMWLARIFTGGWVCRMALLIGFASLVLAAFNLGPWWLAIWRFVAGLTAVSGMILAPTLVTQGVRSELCGRLLGFTFAGAGIGIVLLSLTLPPVMGHDAQTGWLYTAGLTMACLVISWPGLKTKPCLPESKKDDGKNKVYRGKLILLAAGYFIAAAAIVPHSLYLAAYIHLDLHQPLGISVMIYAIFGAGILLGGILLDGLLAAWIGHYLAMLAAMIIGLASILMVVLTDSVWIAAASGFVLGVSQMGFASIATHRVLVFAGQAGHVKWWGTLAILFNSGMAAASFAMGYMIYIGWGFKAGFWMAGACFVITLIINALITTPKRLVQEDQVAGHS